VHSCKTFKALAALPFHRDSVYAVAFAPTAPVRQATKRAAPSAGGDSDDEDDGDDRLDGEGRPRAWLAAAGKDQRISLWELYPLAR